MPNLQPSRLLLAVAITVLLSACAQPAKVSQTPHVEAVPFAPPVTPVPHFDRTQGLAEPISRTPAAKPPMRIAFVYVGPVGDQGWSYSHDQGRKAVEQAYGNQVQVTYVEKVPEGPAGEATFRELVARGNTLIFGTAFGYMEPMLNLARSHPTVRFENATGYKTSPNLRVYDVRSYEATYLAGILAGATTKTNVLGVVASIPIPETIRNVNSFTLGAQSVNPRVRVKVSWAQTWFNPPVEGQRAKTLMDAGADVLMQTTDSTAVLQAAQERGKRAVGWDSDMQAFAPRAHLGSAVTNFGPYYCKAVGDALQGTWSSGKTWWGVKEGAVDLVSVAPDVSPKTVRSLEAAKAGLREGRLQIWAGPVLDQSGRVVLAAGRTFNDEALQGMAFFVRGVEGSIPR